MRPGGFYCYFYFSLQSSLQHLHFRLGAPGHPEGSVSRKLTKTTETGNKKKEGETVLNFQRSRARTRILLGSTRKVIRACDRSKPAADTAWLIGLPLIYYFSSDLGVCTGSLDYPSSRIPDDYPLTQSFDHRKSIPRQYIHQPHHFPNLPQFCSCFFPFR